MIDEDDDEMFSENKKGKGFGSLKHNFLSIKEDRGDFFHFEEDGEKDESSFLELGDFLDL